MPHFRHYISQRRLIYLVQLLRSNATFLKALLATPQATKSGWTHLLLQDLWSLARFHGKKLCELGDPCLNSQVWSDFICKWPRQWKELVKSWLPASGEGEAVDLAHVTHAAQSREQASNCSCSVCGFRFESERALKMHCRVKHQARSKVKSWCGDDNRCCVCGLTFSTRLRLIAHLTDSRIRFGRQPCQRFLNRFPQIPPEVCARLDQLDKQARLKAHRKGTTQPRSTAPPKRACDEDELPHFKRRRVSRKQPAIWECAPRKVRRTTT